MARSVERSEEPGPAGWIRAIRESVVGDGLLLQGPFGPRRITYADYASYGRALEFVEDHIRREVLPWYADTRNESSKTGRMMSRARERARATIRHALGAGDDVAVLFTGSGATAPVDGLIEVLGLRGPAPFGDHQLSRDAIPESERPVVFTSPDEYRSDEPSWRKSIADIIVVPQDAAGGVDMAGLEAGLVRYAERPLLIGSFSMASDVTGLRADTAAVSGLLNKYGALVCWDAAAASHVRIDMGAAGSGDPHLDAVHLAPQRLVGGAGASGALAVRKELIGAGVRQETRRPDILGAIRAGLTFEVKQFVGTDLIEEREERFVRRAMRSWAGDRGLMILGDPARPRLAVVSFLVRGRSAAFLHHNFVVALLDDLFGIQASGGCPCAGLCGHCLLGVGPDSSMLLEYEILKGRGGVKPGWVRIGFPYFMSESTFRFIVEAVHLIAEHGAALIPQYRFDFATGIWTHHRGVEAPAPRLSPLGPGFGPVVDPPLEISGSDGVLDGYLKRARAILGRAETEYPPARGDLSAGAGRSHQMLWFDQP